MHPIVGNAPEIFRLGTRLDFVFVISLLKFNLDCVSGSRETSRPNSAVPTYGHAPSILAAPPRSEMLFPGPYCHPPTCGPEPTGHPRSGLPRRSRVRQWADR